MFLDTVDKNEPEAHERIEQSLVISDTFAHNMYAPISAIKDRIAENDKPFKAILFVPTVKFTKFYCSVLERLFPSLPVYEFHGKIDQRKRTKMVQLFKRAHEGIFVCTDVGARGMDFPDVEEVYQLGVPSELSNYIHRIGRTARGGKDGKASIYLCKDELPFIDTLANQKNVNINEQKDYVYKESDSEEFSKCLKDEYLFREGLESMLSFYKGCEQSYGFYMPRIARQIANAYGVCLGQPDKKLPISREIASMRYGLKGRLVDEIFDCGPQRHREEFNGERRSYGSNRSSYGSNRSYDSDRSSYDSNRPRRSGNNYESRGKSYKDTRGRWDSNRGFDDRRSKSFHQGENPKIDHE